MLPKRFLTGAGAAAFLAASLLLIAGQFWALYLRPVSPLLHGQLFLGILLCLSFLLLKPTERAGDSVPWYDWVLAGLSLMPALYAAWDYSAFVRRTVLTTPTDIAMAALLVLLLLEACRRAVGLVLPVLAGIFLGYALLGNVPFFAELGIPPISMRRLAGTMYITELGIFSEAIQVAVRWIFIFLLFGAFLLLAGGQEFFSDLARSLNSRRKGAPAYIAIWSSAFFGMLSGSNMANVMTTGQFTIPLMRQAGYTGITAAAIESVASTGGALTPPIMAAGALIMAEFTGRPYFDIVAAAIIPAILFYLGLIVYVMGVTARSDIQVTQIDRPKVPIGLLLLRNWAILASLFWLIYRIATFYPVERAGLEAIVPLAIGLLLHHRDNLRPTILFERLSGVLAGLVDVGVACAASGVLVGVILLTGVGVELSNFMFAIGSDSLLLALVLTMIVTIILGMGVPGIAAYVIAAAVVAPPLIQLGLPPIAAHMFIFYFSLFAGITPPVALTAFAAAGIARTPPFQTGVRAMVMALPAYIVAYAFALEPALLLEGDLSLLAYQTTVSTMGIIIFASGSSGYLLRPLAIWERLAACIGGVGFIYPAAWGDLLSTAIVLPLLAWLWATRSGERHLSAPLNKEKAQ